MKMGPKYNFEASTVLKEGRVPTEILDKLKEWLSKQKLPILSDEQLVLFSLSCYNVLEDTQKTISAHFKLKSVAPELYFNRDLSAEDVQKGMNLCHVSVIPARTQKNYGIIMWKLHDTSYHRFNLEAVVKFTIMVGELIYYTNPPDGVIILIDLKGLGLLHVTKMRIGPLRKFFQFVQEGYGCKIKAIHVLNTVYFIDKIMFIMKPLMSKELYNMIKFHHTNSNMEEFYEKYLGKDYLPQDYGGNLEQHAVLTAQTYSVFQGMKQFYQDEEEQIKQYISLQNQHK